jgi:hypothetical protein
MAGTSKSKTVSPATSIPVVESALAVETAGTTAAVEIFEAADVDLPNDNHIDFREDALATSTSTTSLTQTDVTNREARTTIVSVFELIKVDNKLTMPPSHPL